MPLQSTGTQLWSLIPAEIQMPALASSGEDPAVAVCMEQTFQTEPECAGYLARPSNPGGGGA